MGERDKAADGSEGGEVAAHTVDPESLPELIAAARELVDRKSARAQLDLLWERIDAVLDSLVTERQLRALLRRHAR